MPRVPAEITKAQYMLKATFFFERLESLGFFDLYDDIRTIAKDHSKGFSWNKKEDLCIDAESWDIIQKVGIDPLMVFTHPNILKMHPIMLKYYRSVAMLPQKGLSAISGFSNVSGVESGACAITELKLDSVVCALNEVMSASIKLAGSLDMEKIRGMMFATAGTTIEGSWRNQIGNEGERVIRTILLKKLIENDEIVAFILKNGTSIELSEWGKDEPIAHIKDIASFTNKNGTIVVFRSEPDIEFRDSEGTVLGGVEIKAGLDPAGALERLGAMFKSFESMLSRYPKAETILIAACITDEVDARLRSSRSVCQTYILTDVINNKKGVSDIFCNSIRGTLGLVDKRM